MKETPYLFQSFLIILWWVGLITSPPFFAAFQFQTIPDVAFWSFFAPDILLIAILSFVRAYRRLPELEYIILGAFAYATLYCVNATVLTHSGYLPTGVMTAGLCYNLFLCFSPALFRTSYTGIKVNLAKTLLQIFCIWTLTLGIIPYFIIEAFGSLSLPSFRPTTTLGILIFLSNAILGLYSAYHMVTKGDGTPLPLDQTNCLVVSGPYKYVRNPMAVAGIGQSLGIALLFQSLPLALYSLIGALVWHIGIRPFEEHDLTKRFGADYLLYRKHTSCWIPKLRSHVLKR